jgi:hypothetical protein
MHGCEHFSQDCFKLSRGLCWTHPLGCYTATTTSQLPLPPSHLRHSFLGIADLAMALEKRQDQNMLAWDEAFGDGKWECNAIPRPWRNYSCELVNFPITCSFAKYLKGSNPQSTPWSTCDGNCMYMEQEGFYAFIGIATAYPRIASLQNSQRAL